jgi:cation transport ATPase
MMQIPGKIYLGGSVLSVKKSSSADDCESSCIKKSGCTGATFNSQNLTCSLSNGEGSVVAATQYNTAITNELQYLISIMDNLNDQLTSTNQAIQNINATSESIFNEDETLKTSQDQQLVSDYNNLVQERKEIAEMIRQYEKIDKEDNQTSLMTTQTYYSYIILVIFVLLIVYMLFAVSSMSNMDLTNAEGKPTITVVYLIICLVIVFFFGLQFYQNVYTTATNYMSTTNIDKNSAYLVTNKVNTQGIAVIIIILIIIYVYYLKQI